MLEPRDILKEYYIYRNTLYQSIESQNIIQMTFWRSIIRSNLTQRGKDISFPT